MMQPAWAEDLNRAERSVVHARADEVDEDVGLGDAVLEAECGVIDDVVSAEVHEPGVVAFARDGGDVDA
jgi:hypothetical protein